MSGPQLEVVSPGAYASVQDLGRRGYRRAGVPWAGVLDARLMRIANALVGQPGEAPVIECFDGGLQLVARGGPVRVAVAGDAELVLDCQGERTALPAWRSVVLADGDLLQLRRLVQGRVAVVAVAGLALPAVLGSVATYARAGLGGVQGQALAAGMRLPAALASARTELMLAEPPRPVAAPIRVLAGPQADHFNAAVRAAFVQADYRVSTQADRMGVRLEGPPLVHGVSPDIVSDATVPGSIQVPGNGQPIVLLADAQTAGGYPKVGTVVGADLPRLAAMRPGQSLRFAWVTADAAERSARDAEATTLALLQLVRPLTVGGVDEAALYTHNLLSGFVNALAPQDPAPDAPDAPGPHGDPR